MLNEYNSYEELLAAFWNFPAEMTKTGVQLASSKTNAEKKLKYQHELHPMMMARVFWSKKATYEGTTTFVMYEAIFD